MSSNLEDQVVPTAVGEKGLVIGKFMPLQLGHVALGRFAAAQVKHLTILVCHSPEQPIPGEERLSWAREAFSDLMNVTVEYMSQEMPDSQESSRDISKYWAAYLKGRFPDVDTIFSSEKYGEYLAEYMGIRHVSFDEARKIVPISATMIRENPFKYWDYIAPSARPYFLKRVCIYGPESCGKSTLTEKLAAKYRTVFVPEMAREHLGDRHCEPHDMLPIGELHAKTILQKEKEARGVLFVDSDLITTKVYSEHYFGFSPDYPRWVEAANRYDLYLLLEIDVPWVKDPQRDLGHLREHFMEWFERELKDRGLPYVRINGSWEEREKKASEAIDGLLNRR